jgi:hypothetical protein
VGFTNFRGACAPTSHYLASPPVSIPIKEKIPHYLYPLIIMDIKLPHKSWLVDTIGYSIPSDILVDMIILITKVSNKNIKATYLMC